MKTKTQVAKDLEVGLVLSSNHSNQIAELTDHFQSIEQFSCKFDLEITKQFRITGKGVGIWVDPIVPRWLDMRMILSI